MFKDEPMAPERWAFLMPMVDDAEVRKWRIASLIAGFAEGTWLTGPELEDITGINVARRFLKALVDDHIVDCDGEGGHKRWYRINPRYWEWRVRWRHPVARVTELLDHLERQAAEHPVDRFTDPENRASSRAFASVNARLLARFSDDQWAQMALQAAKSRQQPRDFGYPGVKEALKSRQQPRDFRPNRAGSRAISAARQEEEEVLLPSSRPEGLSSSSPTGPSARMVDPDEWTKVSAAVRRRCRPGPDGRPAYIGLNSRPEQRLKELLARCGVDELVAGVERLEAGVHMVPSFVEQLAVSLAMPAGDVAPVPAANVSELETRRREKLRGLDQLIATFRADGAEPPPEVLDERAELAGGLAHETGADDVDDPASPWLPAEECHTSRVG